MKKTKTDRIRLAVFKVWFITLLVVLLVFAFKFLGSEPVAPSFQSAFQSLQMMVGLIVPQISMMAAFYFNLDKQTKKIESLTEGQVTVITWMSVSYHAIFILSVISGIMFYKFDSSPDGKALERNTAAVLAIMGLFSVFLAPIAFLFSTPKASAPSSSARVGKTDGEGE